MSINLNDFNRVVLFFLGNYNEKILEYQKASPDFKRLWSINKAENRILPNVIDGWKRVNQEVMRTSPGNEEKRVMQMLNTYVGYYLPMLDQFLKAEKGFLDGKIDNQRFLEEFESFRMSAAKFPRNEIANLLESVKTSKSSLKKRVKDYLVGRVIYPVVATELFLLILTSYNAVAQKDGWKHPDAGFVLLLYSINVMMSMTKMTDRLMEVLPRLAKRRAAT